MFCPQCGGANDDSARFCNMCGMDLVKYKEEWGGSTDQASTPATEAYQRPPDQSNTYQQPYQPTYEQPYQPPYQPTYQQQYSSGYQQPPYGAAGRYGAIPNIPSYMGWAIAVLILCFWPTGIAAVVYASQVNNKLTRGDIDGARESSRKAKTWCWVSFGIAILWIVIAILVGVFASVASFNIY